MNVPLLVASVLTVALVAAHSYLGERYILIRLFKRDDLPKLLGTREFTKQTLRLAWHITSVFGLGLAGLLAVLASSEGIASSMLARIIAATCALSGVVALVGSQGRHVSWVVFFAIAALTWFGHR